jgi:hypothetical protein
VAARFGATVADPAAVDELGRLTSMRLTLRTLLAWLDDTLPPAEVRQIGHQVTDSPFAQELVERIHRVTRQRRLTVPPSNAPDSTDSNLVASYLDNELDPEQVAEYEKKCLTSDVHLAEVASSHQILSLIGQKAKVPVEARHRMYRLVKGREAVSPRVPRAFSPPPPDPLTEPLVPWAPPEPPPRSWLVRYGPAGIVCMLIILLLWSTWMSLNPDTTGSSRVSLAQAVAKAAKQEAPAPDAAKAGAANAAAAGAENAQAAGEAAAPKPDADAAAAAAEPAKAASETPEVPVGSLGLVEDSDAVLLRLAAGRGWQRIRTLTTLKDGDRLVCLDRFRSPIQLGSAHLRLVGETEINVRAPGKDLAAQLDLVRGRVVLLGPKPAAPFGVNFRDQKLKITPPAGAAVGLETIDWGPGSPGLRVIAADGDVAIEAGDAKETLSGPAVVVFQAPDKFVDKEKRDAPSWVTDANPPPLDKQIGEQFARYFTAEHRVMQGLVEAAGDPNKDVRQLAIASLGALGEAGVEEVTSALGSQGDSAVRRAAIRTIRMLGSRGPDMVKAIRDQLLITFGNPQAETVEKLIVGFTPRESVEDATYNKLVQLLSNSDLAVRELAIDNLQQLTGRDDHGYTADAPEGEGLKKWQELLRKHELRPQTPPPPQQQAPPAPPAPAAAPPPPSPTR